MLYIVASRCALSQTIITGFASRVVDLTGFRQAARAPCHMNQTIVVARDCLSFFPVRILSDNTSKMPASMSASTNNMSELHKGRSRGPGPARVLELLDAVLGPTSSACFLRRMLSKYTEVRKQPRKSFAMLTCRSMVLAFSGENGFGACPPGLSTCPKA
jgi:hypothetical protein